MSRLDLGEKLLKALFWALRGGLEGPVLLVSEDASSSAVE